MTMIRHTGPNMLTIPRNHTKALDNIFPNARDCRCFDYRDMINGIPARPSEARGALESYRSARLIYTPIANTYFLYVKANYYYTFKGPKQPLRRTST